MPSPSHIPRRPPSWMVFAIFLGASACSTSPCERLALEASSVEAPGQHVSWTQPIWDSIVAVFHGLTDHRTVSLHIIGSGGTWADGSPLGAGAWTCPADQKVFITSELIEHARDLPNGEDFTAFVLSHELAHLRFDGHRDQSALGAARCPSVDTTLEQLADRRAAFLMAQARRPGTQSGRYSPFAIARHDLLRGFFQRELGWASDCHALEDRAHSVEAALDDFSTYQALYSLAMDLHLAGSIGSSTETLSALISHVERFGEAEIAAVPELHVLLALSHLDRARQSTRWPDQTRVLVPPPDQLACTPILPAHSALSTIEAGRTRRGTPDFESFVPEEELAAARAALGRATRLGVDPLLLLGIEACVSALEGDYVHALNTARNFTRGVTLTPLVATAKRNETIIELMGSVGGAWLEPVASAPWRSRMAAFAETIAAPELRALARTWAGGAPDSSTDEVAPSRPTDEIGLDGATVTPSHRTALATDFDALLIDLKPSSQPTPLGLRHSSRGPLTASRIELARPPLNLIYSVASTQAPGPLAHPEVWSDCEVVKIGIADDGLEVERANCREPQKIGTWTSWLLYRGASGEVHRIARVTGEATDLQSPIPYSPTLEHTTQPSSNRSTGHRHALIVGIDSYRHEGAGDCAQRQHRDLQGASNDALAFEGALRARGFDDIRTLIDGKPGDPPATRDNIMRALSELANLSWVGHDVVFYFAGHGSQALRSDGTTWDTLVPKDSSACGFDLSDKELAVAFNKILWAVDPDDTGRGSLTVVLDACHSGSAARSSTTTRSLTGARVIAPPPPVGRPRVHGAVILSAATKDELAHEFTAPDGQRRGVFTYHLLQALEATSEASSVGHLHQDIRQRMQSLDQTPWLEPEGSQRLLFTSGKRDEEAVRFVVDRYGLIDGGLSLGLVVGTRLVAWDPARTLRARVSEVGLTHARVEHVEGEAIVAGLALKVDPQSHVHAQAFVARQGPTESELIAAARSVAALRAAEVVVLAEDTPARTHVLWFEAGNWWLRAARTSEPTRLGPHFAPAAILTALGPRRTESQILIVWPAPAEVAQILTESAYSSRSAAAANFMLGSTLTLLPEPRVEVAWIPTHPLREASPLAFGLPRFWTPTHLTNPSPTASTSLKMHLTRQLETQRLLETLHRAESNHSPTAFGYRLRLLRQDLESPDGWHVPATAPLSSAWSFGMSAESGADPADRRFVYLFAVEADGSSCLLFPHSAGENAFPRENDLRTEYRLELEFEDMAWVFEQCGPHAFVLLSSETPLRTEHVFASSKTVAGCSPQAARGGAKGQRSGGAQPNRPLARTGGRWSIERVFVEVHGCEEDR